MLLNLMHRSPAASKSDSTEGAKTPYIKDLDDADVAAIEKAVKKEMESQKIVGCAVGVLRDNKIVYLNGFGLADREKLPVTNETVFNWASNSKPLAAFRAMQLVRTR